MKSLIIETSTERGLVAVANDTRILSSCDLPFGLQNSTFLLPTIQKILSELNLKASDLDLIITGIGPGSYTGIRVGAITAKTFSYSCKKPLVGICTLKGFVPKAKGMFAAIIDAKIGGVYLLKGKRVGDNVEYLSEPFVCPLGELQDHIKDVKTFVTPNSQRLRGLLSELYPGLEWCWEEVAPCAQHFLDLGLTAFREGKYSTDGQLELLYLRKAVLN